MVETYPSHDLGALLAFISRSDQIPNVCHIVRGGAQIPAKLT
jgi:hypothetical protein